MIRRVLISALVALCLVLTSLAAVVAETRMAAAGGYCGSDAPQILLNASGLPELDQNGQAIAALECPVCHLSVAMIASVQPQLSVQRILLGAAEPTPKTSLFPLVVQLGGQARAPPRTA